MSKWTVVDPHNQKTLPMEGLRVLIVLPDRRVVEAVRSNIGWKSIAGTTVRWPTQWRPMPDPPAEPVPPYIAKLSRLRDLYREDDPEAIEVHTITAELATEIASLRVALLDKINTADIEVLTDTFNERVRSRVQIEIEKSMQQHIDDLMLQKDQAMKAIERLGHTPHCAARMAWGDGECECGGNNA